MNRRVSGVLILIAALLYQTTAALGRAPLDTRKKSRLPNGKAARRRGLRWPRSVSEACRRLSPRRKKEKEGDKVIAPSVPDLAPQFANAALVMVPQPLETLLSAVIGARTPLPRRCRIRQQAG